MAVKIKSSNDAESTDFPALDAVTAEGRVTSRSVITGEDRPIALFVHDLAPGAEISWSGPARSHAAYLWDGSAESGGVALRKDAALIIEHGANADLRAGPDGARVVHFVHSPAHSDAPRQDGGHVHAVMPDGVYTGRYTSGSFHTLIAESNCPHCDTWLHRSHFPVPATPGTGIQVPAHFHTEDEVIFILSGGVKVGTRALGPGTALAVDANTTYTFRTSDAGVVFINFRPSNPYVVMMDRGKPFHAPMSEREDIRTQGRTMTPIMEALIAGMPLPPGTHLEAG